MNNWTCFDVTLEGGVAHVRMNQPQRHNAMTPAFWAEIPQVFRGLDEAGGVRAAVLVAEIPRNPSGKILKRVLREQFKDTLRAPE